MRKYLRNCLSMSLPILAGACSIYPTTQDTTGLRTYDIVRHVRCETRYSVARFYTGVFKNEENIDSISYAGMTGREVLERLSSPATLRYWDIDWKKLHPRVKKVWKNYGDASVSYDFTLDNTEMNTQGAQLDITRGVFGQTSRLPFSLKDDKTRQVLRNFRVFDTFAELVQANRLGDYCKGVGGPENWHYPMAGRKNIHDLVQNFLDLNQSGNLSGPADRPTAPTMADTVQFTTKVALNADPFLVLNPITRTFTPTGATFNLDNYRQDYHKVIIAISLPPEKGGFTSAALVAEGERPWGRPSSEVLGAVELNRQQRLATENSLQQINQTLQSPSPLRSFFPF